MNEKKVLWTSFTMYKKILYFLIIKLLEIRFKNSLKAKFGFLVNFILKTGSQIFFLKTTNFNNLTHRCATQQNYPKIILSSLLFLVHATLVKTSFVMEKFTVSKLLQYVIYILYMKICFRYFAAWHNNVITSNRRV